MIEQSVHLASNGSVQVSGYEQLARFGYTKNRGVYRLHVDATVTGRADPIKRIIDLEDAVASMT